MGRKDVRKNIDKNGKYDIFCKMTFTVTAAEKEVLLFLKSNECKADILTLSALFSDKNVAKRAFDGCIEKGFAIESGGKIMLTQSGRQQV